MASDWYTANDRALRFRFLSLLSFHIRLRAGGRCMLSILSSLQTIVVAVCSIWAEPVSFCNALAVGAVLSSLLCTSGLACRAANTQAVSGTECVRAVWSSMALLDEASS